MLKSLLLGAMLLMGTAVAFSGTVYIENSNELAMTAEGKLVPASNGWVVVVYRDGGNGRIDPFREGDDQIVTVLNTGWAEDGHFMFSFSFEGGARLYYRAFNCSDFVSDEKVGSASKYADFKAGLKGIPILGMVGMSAMDPGGLASNAWKSLTISADVRDR